MESKLTSGKFILTVVCAFVFAFLSINQILPTDKVMEILLIVIYAYFTKKTDNNNKGGAA